MLAAPRRRSPRSAAAWSSSALCGLGIAFMVAADLGLAPWSVLDQGLLRAHRSPSGRSASWSAQSCSWRGSRFESAPASARSSTSSSSAWTIDAALLVLDTPGSMVGRLAYLTIGVFLWGPGSGFYIGAGLGPGPRDGPATGLGWQRRRLDTSRANGARGQRPRRRLVAGRLGRPGDRRVCPHDRAQRSCSRRYVAASRWRDQVTRRLAEILRAGAVAGRGAGARSDVAPMSQASTAAAQPDLGDGPHDEALARPMSPATNTPSSDDIQLSDRATLPRPSRSTPSAPSSPSARGRRSPERAGRGRPAARRCPRSSGNGPRPSPPRGVAMRPRCCRAVPDERLRVDRCISRSPPSSCAEETW